MTRNICQRGMMMAGRDGLILHHHRISNGGYQPRPWPHVQAFEGSSIPTTSVPHMNPTARPRGPIHAKIRPMLPTNATATTTDNTNPTTLSLRALDRLIGLTTLRTNTTDVPGQIIPARHAPAVPSPTPTTQRATDEGDGGVGGDDRTRLGCSGQRDHREAEQVLGGRPI